MLAHDRNNVDLYLHEATMKMENSKMEREEKLKLKTWMCT
jgi:hypothetical protein